MSDIEQRLRDHVRNRGGSSLSNGAWDMMLEAADAIDRLTKERDEARAGHNHHRRKSSSVKVARNRAIDGMEHWKERALAAEAAPLSHS